MKAQSKVEILKLQGGRWQPPVNISKYDCHPLLTDSEKKEIQVVLEKKSTWFAKSYEILGRLLNPIHDTLKTLKSSKPARVGTVRVILHEMNERSSSFWAWTSEVWYQIFSNDSLEFIKKYNVPGDTRGYLMCVTYLLVDTFEYLSPSLHANQRLMAHKIFGKDLIEESIKRVCDGYIELGYGQQKIKSNIPNNVAYISLTNRSPYLEDITRELLEKCRINSNSKYVGMDLVRISRVLTNLGIIAKPLKLVSEQKESSEDTLVGILPEWVSWCKRWRDTSTLAPNTRNGIYYRLLKIGRWLAQTHPEVINPSQWTREIAIEFVAVVDQMKVGEWASETKRATKINRLNEPLAPRGKEHYLHAIRKFLQDCQEWEWITRKFNPQRVLATPRSIRALIGPSPRVIADDIWAKLLWAGLNLTEDDLPIPDCYKEKNIKYHYPLEMVQAIIVVWLFTGLRSNEIYRLHVGCVRWQKNDVVLPGTNEVVLKDTVCYLDIPTNKTSTAYTKPVDRIVGEAIAIWEKARPNQPSMPDRKTGSIANYLFFYRGRKLGKSYINRSIIPMLCNKAGVPNKDAIGKITSHRARSTIASQLCSAKEPMTLFELKEWLGHRHVSSTINYTKVSPTKLASSYKDTDYFKRNIRTIEVLIDQDAIKSGAAASGEAWRFYDLGHGYCTYDFFDSCKHRMACAKCNFYLPKDSSKAQILESKANLQRMLQEIPLTEEERAAIEDGIEAMEKLTTKLANIPTPSGQTPQ